MKRAAAAKSCGSTVSAKSKSALDRRRRVSDTAITNLCAGSRSIGLPARTVNFLNIGDVAQHYRQNIFKYIT